MYRYLPKCCGASKENETKRFCESKDVLNKAPSMSDTVRDHVAAEAPEGVAVGALLAPKRMVQTIIEELDQRGWRKRARIARVDDDTMAVALVPEGARALDKHTQCEGAVSAGVLPAKLAQLLGDGVVHWASGLRMGVDGAGGAASVGCEVPQKPYAALDGGPSVAPRPETAAFRYAELFAGIGGFRLGLDALGGCCVFASEIDQSAAATYERNFSDRPSGDITQVATEGLPSHEILTAGFPCQSFSRTGEQGGLSDARGDLFYEILRVARARKPAVLLLENVPNLVRLEGGHTIHRIVHALTGAGYHVRVQLLNARAWAPQHRERLFLVCFRADLSAVARRFEWPKLPTARPPALRAVLETLPSGALCRYRLSPAQWAKVRTSADYRTDAQWRLAQLSGVARTLRGSYRKSYTRFSEFVPLDAAGEVEAGAEEEAGAVGEAGEAGEVVAVGEAGVTGRELDEGDDEGGDEGGDGEEGAEDEKAVAEPSQCAAAAEVEQTNRPAPRFYTERECARLQGFPEGFVLEGPKLYTQLGNAVCPLLVRALGRCVLRALDGEGGMPRAPPDAADAPEADGAAAPVGRACEEGLCAAAINLLRGVTPPMAVGPAGAMSAKTPEPGAQAYGRYGHEAPSERARRVRERPPDRLFCLHCEEVYSMEAR